MDNAALFDIRDVDTRFYHDFIEGRIPDTIIDVHTHVFSRALQRRAEKSERIRENSWPELVAHDNPVSDLADSYELMFPGKRVTPLIFGMPEALSESSEDQKTLEQKNSYIEETARDYGYPSLLLTHPSWPADEFERRVIEGNHAGAKVYLDMAPMYLPRGELRIYDFLTPEHLQVLNRNHWVVILHIPRKDRLRDRVNLEQMVEIEQRWPEVKVIIAHVGRAYCNEDVGNAFDILQEAHNLIFDISANTNQWVFEKLIEAVGPRRILFGSDLPIVRMRTRRICEDGSYVNLVPKGVYEGIEKYAHMREVSSPESEEITFFLYEEIAAFLRAADAVGLGPNDMERVFFSNAAEILKLGRG